MNPCFFMTFYSKINPVYNFYWKMNIIRFAQICGGFSIIVNKFFLFITLSISLSYKAKINLAVLFRHKNSENQYMSHKKYSVHLGLSEPFNLVCLQFSFSVRKTHSPSSRYTIYYFFFNVFQ